MVEDHIAERMLIERAQAGDEEAFTGIIQRYKRPVLDFVFRMTGDPAAAQDLAQDVFVRVWRGIGRYRPRSGAAFSTWLFQIARNACIDVYRRRSRDPLRMASDDPLALEKTASSGSVEKEVAAREVGEQVAAAMAKLPEDQRTVVALAEYEGLSYREIAVVMTCSVKSVESRLYRARQTLRHALRNRFD